MVTRSMQQECSSTTGMIHRLGFCVESCFTNLIEESAILPIELHLLI